VQGLGFSAFDLMFGRSVRGPLYLIRSQLNDDWVSDLKKQNLIDFVLNLRETCTWFITSSKCMCCK